MGKRLATSMQHIGHGCLSFRKGHSILIRGLISVQVVLARSVRAYKIGKKATSREIGRHTGRVKSYRRTRIATVLAVPSVLLQAKEFHRSASEGPTWYHYPLQCWNAT